MTWCPEALSPKLALAPKSREQISRNCRDLIKLTLWRKTGKSFHSVVENFSWRHESRGSSENSLPLSPEQWFLVREQRLLGWKSHQNHNFHPNLGSVSVSTLGWTATRCGLCAAGPSPWCLRKRRNRRCVAFFWDRHKRIHKRTGIVSARGCMCVSLFSGRFGEKRRETFCGGTPGGTGVRSGRSGRKQWHVPENRYFFALKGD